MVNKNEGGAKKEEVKGENDRGRTGTVEVVEDLRHFPRGTHEYVTTRPPTVDSLLLPFCFFSFRFSTASSPMGTTSI